MRCAILTGAAAFLAALSTAPLAAQPVVQLPTFRQFSISTTVVVPDSGTAYLGGISGATSGRRRGAFGNAALGGGRQAGMAGITAQVHDFAALDAAVLQQAAPKPPSSAAPNRGDFAARLHNALGRDASPASAGNVASPPEPPSRADQAQADFQRAEQAAAQGKTALAAAYYRRVAGLNLGPLSQQAHRRLAALAAPSSR